MSLPSRFFGSLWCQSCLAGCSAHTHTHTQHNTQTQHTHKHNTRVTINQQQQLQTHKTSTISFIRSQGQHHKHMQTDVGGARLILKQEQQQQQTCSQRCCSCFNISFIHQSLTGIFQMHVLKWKHVLYKQDGKRNSTGETYMARVLTGLRSFDLKYSYFLL